MKEHELELLEYYENDLFKSFEAREAAYRCERILENQNQNVKCVFDIHIIESSYYTFKEFGKEELIRELTRKKIPHEYLKVVYYVVQYREYLELLRKKEDEDFLEKLPEIQ